MIHDFSKFTKDALPCKGTIKVYKMVGGKKTKFTEPCNHLPEINKVGDMYYAQCKHCTRWDPYQFLGTNPKSAIAQWNAYNSKHAPEGIFLD